MRKGVLISIFGEKCCMIFLFLFFDFLIFGNKIWCMILMKRCSFFLFFFWILKNSEKIAKRFFLLSYFLRQRGFSPISYFCLAIASLKPFWDKTDRRCNEIKDFNWRRFTCSSLLANMIFSFGHLKSYSMSLNHSKTTKSLPNQFKYGVAERHE